MKNNQVAQRFWEQSPKPAKSRSLFYEPEGEYQRYGKLFSYGTVILQRVGTKIIGNATRYSQTTSCHQSIASVWNADVVLYDVLVGCTDLIQPAKQLYVDLHYVLAPIGEA